MNLTRHPLKSAPLALAERDDARARIASIPAGWPQRRLMPLGLDQQGRYLTRACRSERWPDTVATDFGEQPEPAEASTSIGADTRPAALSMRRHRSAGRVALALIVAPAVAAVVGVATFIGQHWPG